MLADLGSRTAAFSQADSEPAASPRDLSSRARASNCARVSCPWSGSGLTVRKRHNQSSQRRAALWGSQSWLQPAFSRLSPRVRRSPASDFGVSYRGKPQAVQAFASDARRPITNRPQVGNLPHKIVAAREEGKDGSTKSAWHVPALRLDLLMLSEQYWGPASCPTHTTDAESSESRAAYRARSTVPHPWESPKP